MLALDKHHEAADMRRCHGGSRHEIENVLLVWFAGENVHAWGQHVRLEDARTVLSWATAREAGDYGGRRSTQNCSGTEVDVRLCERTRRVVNETVHLVVGYLHDRMI